MNRRVFELEKGVNWHVASSKTYDTHLKTLQKIYYDRYLAKKDQFGFSEETQYKIDDRRKMIERMYQKERYRNFECCDPES